MKTWRKSMYSALVVVIPALAPVVEAWTPAHPVPEKGGEEGFFTSRQPAATPESTSGERLEAGRDMTATAVVAPAIGEMPDKNAPGALLAGKTVPIVSTTPIYLANCAFLN